MSNIFLIIFIIYYLIATFILCNFLFNSNLDIVAVNTKTKTESKPSTLFLMFYCLFWIIFLPISIYKGEEK